MKKKVLLMLLAVAMALILTPPPASGATLEDDTTVEVYADTNFNVSVYPGLASYSGKDGAVTGVFGDGTVLDYRFFNVLNIDGVKVLNSYADGGTGIIAPVANPPQGNISGPMGWCDVWTATAPNNFTDPNSPADFIYENKVVYTTAGAQNITGTIDIFGMKTGTVYFLYGTYVNNNTVTVTMSGPGQPDIEASHTEVAPSNVGWITSFTFSDAAAYDTITYHYQNDDLDGSRARFIGLIIDGDLDPLKPIPADGTTASGGTVDLSWTNRDPNENSSDPDVYVDVYFGTSPESLTKLIDATTAAGVNATTLQVNAPTIGSTYYWQVDSYLHGDPAVVAYGGEGQPTKVTGALYTFITADLPPTLVGHDNMMIWSGGNVPLSPVIEDDGASDLSYLWTVNEVEGVTVEFVPEDSYTTETPTVKVTKVPVLIPFVPNHSFEQVISQSAITTSRDTWGHYDRPPGTGYALQYVPNTTYHFPDDDGKTPPDGNIICRTNTKVGESRPDGLAIILDSTFDPTATYELSAAVGHPHAVPDNAAYSDATWRGYLVQLVVGGEVESSGSGADNIYGGSVIAEDANSITIARRTWETSIVTYAPPAEPNMALAGQPIQIRLLALDDPDPTYASQTKVFYDNVELRVNGELGTYVYYPEMSTVGLTLAVNDATTPDYKTEGSMTIDVYDNACLMAVLGEGKQVDNPTDINGDCVTNVEDLAAMVTGWLTNVELTAPF